MAALTTTAGPQRLAAPPLPREHGSWFMLLVPCAVGLFAAGAPNLPGVLFAFVATAFFLARQPLLLLVRPGQASAFTLWFWLGVWAAGSGLGMLALLTIYHRLLLLPLAGIGLALLLYEVWRASRSPRPDLRTEIIAAIGLASGAPGAYVAVHGVFDLRAAMVWVLSGLYFLAAVYYVNLMLAWVKRNPHTLADRRALGKVTAGIHFAVLAASAAFALVGLAPALTPVAFLPALLKTLNQVWRGGRQTSFKRLGLVEAGQSLLFLALITVAYRFRV